jgi:hypothetical protein
MGTKVSSRSASAEREHHRTNLWAQLARFVGLPLAPVIGIFMAWLIHLWAAGVHIHWGHRINWDLNTPRGMPTVAAVTISLVTVWIAHKAWQFTEHRKDALRNALTTSVGLIGVMFAIGVGVGPSYLWSGLFFLSAWAVAAVWIVARLDVTRNDKQTEQTEDTFLEKVGLKGWRARKSTPVVGKDGEVLATEIEMQHAPGDTVEQLQDAVPAFESVSASPSGLSRATARERADRSTLTVMHRDPLVTPAELPEWLSAGSSISEPLLCGTYANGEYVQAYLAGGPGWSPTSYLMMGMNRTGKTQEENIMLSGVIARRDAVILYLNKAKGLQDCRPIIPGVEVAVIDSEEGASSLYREAIRQVKRMIGYRQAQLAMFNIHEWNAEQCWDNPPWRTVDGKRVQMERMPFLICHVGEADAILQEAPGDATYIVSKGLSTGICTGWSLQRADATKMPTGLRFNLATAWCFGCGDADSASMALSDWVVKAGAHPEKWGQRKAGYFYFEGLGIPEENFTIPARSFSLGPNGTPLREELLRRNLYWAPRMAKLDRGTADATGQPGEQSWWDATAKATEDLRRKLLAGSAKPEPANPPAVADDDEQEDWDEMRDDIRNTTEVEGVDLYPQELGAKFDDATADLPPKLGPQDQLSWEDPKPAPRDRDAAEAAFDAACLELVDDETLRDPADPTGSTVVVTVGMMADRYPFRSRPWFSETLNATASGRRTARSGVIVSAADDLGMAAGKYRIQRPRSGHTP